MANENRNVPAQQGDRDDMSKQDPSDERMRGVGDDVRGIADDSEEDFDDNEDTEDEDEEEEDEGTF